jgi:hypothetical protein
MPHSVATRRYYDYIQVLPVVGRGLHLPPAPKVRRVGLARVVEAAVEETVELSHVVIMFDVGDAEAGRHFAAWQ